MNPDLVTLAITGASGSAYGLRLLECLLQAGKQVYLMISEAGRLVISTETGMELPAEPHAIEQLLNERYALQQGRLRVWGLTDWLAPVASGSNAPAAMVVCPCSMGSLAAIASGASNNLIERAADVVLKERRLLILVVRETPFSSLHLENMLKLSRLGVVIMPASPGFYHRPDSLDQLIDFIVARVLDHLGVNTTLLPRWGQPR